MKSFGSRVDSEVYRLAAFKILRYAFSTFLTNVISIASILKHFQHALTWSSVTPSPELPAHLREAYRDDTFFGIADES